MTPPVAVLADDLTGAAEIAAIGCHSGRRALVLTAPSAPGNESAADLIVIDTDTRLDSPAVAAQRVRAAAFSPTVAKAALLFKKTDSVLRGPVRAEIEAIAAACGRKRVLLVPANPALGRVVTNGRYLIHGQPVSETAFARDPHHPVRSDDVRAMLGVDGSWAVETAAPTQPLPDSGIILGDATSVDDLDVWAQQVDTTTLPAGAAGFFSALLTRNGWRSVPAASPGPSRGPVLVIAGTKQPAVVPDGCTIPENVFAPTHSLIATSQGTARDAWIETIAAALGRHGCAFVSAAALVVPATDTPEKIRRLLADLVASLHERRAFSHLVVEGGATASTIVRNLGWTRLSAVHEWAQGVVTLEPVGVSGVDLTIKPGSYSWPREFGKLRLAADRLPPRGGAA
jgi:uncharacterized protein YgbK (DUF1537 family)